MLKTMMALLLLAMVGCSTAPIDDPELANRDPAAFGKSNVCRIETHAKTLNPYSFCTLGTTFQNECTPCECDVIKKGEKQTSAGVTIPISEYHEIQKAISRDAMVDDAGNPLPSLGSRSSIVSKCGS